MDDIDPAATSGHSGGDGHPQSTLLGPVSIATIVSLAFASVAHLLRYLLMAVNRGELVPGFVASGSTLLVWVSTALAAVCVVWTAWAMARWLIARRAVAYRAIGAKDPRGRIELLLGCLFPVFTLVFPQIYLAELAMLENRRGRLAKPIRLWWILYSLSTLLAIIAWCCRDPSTVQGTANSAYFTAIDYAFAAVAAWSLRRVYFKFSDAEGHHRAVRYLVVESPSPEPAADEINETHPDKSVAPVEPVGEKPAALERDRVVGAW